MVHSNCWNNYNNFNFNQFRIFNQNITETITCFTIFGVSFLTILPNILSGIVGLIKNKGNDTMKSAKNIEQKVGFMADVKRELEILCDFMK